MTVSYNLLTDEWIPASNDTGEIKFRGIVDTLKQAHDLTEISDPSPPIQFGIYRLLVAFLMEVYNIKMSETTVEKLREILDSGKFDVGLIDLYAKKWNDRFDLFDLKHPFMQVPADSFTKKNTEPIVRLMQHIPAGTNVSHFYHGRWDSHAFSFGQCARGLVAIPPFMTAGGAGLSPSINGNPPWYVLVKGESLFKTLLYNICVIQPIVKPIGNRTSAWQREDKLEPKQEAKIFSIVEGLTWQPRMIHLNPVEGRKCTYSGNDCNGLVRDMYYGPGFKAPAPGLWADPQVSYVRTKDGIRSLRPTENRELWRDTGPLMLLQQSDYTRKDGKVSFERPAVVQQFKKLIEDGIIHRETPLVIEVYGVRTDGKMKLFEWNAERLSLPKNIFYRKSTGRQIQEAMDHADEIAYCIKAAIKKAYPRDGNGNNNAFNNVISDAHNAYWRNLRDIFELQYLENLSKQADEDPDAPGKLMEEWKKTLEKEGYHVLEDALGPLDSDGKAIERQVEATREYWRRARNMLFNEKKARSKKVNNKEKLEA